MKKLPHILLCAGALMLSGCEIHDDLSVSIKRKAVVHFVYHYDNGKQETLDDVESMRLFIYDQRGNLFRETTFTPEEILQDSGAMQTYLSNGHYSFVSWANVSGRTGIAPSRLDNAQLSIATTGSDLLMYGRCASSIIKGDSLVFNIDLYKSVFKINVRVKGLESAQFPEDHYFGIINRSGLSFDNKPIGDLKRYRPELTYKNGILAGSFYTPYYSREDDFTIGVYCDNADSQYETLWTTSIQHFSNFTEAALGKDIEINVDVTINDSGITFVITDWEGTIIQESNLGA